ncbi:MAG: accessory factor associated with RNA polymerase II [Alyxoria varia]|nr:MAG: accessory factor associated with RNA polymerase II [Alyxoria varia]
MAEDNPNLDALILLRQAISSDVPPISTTSAEPAGPSSVERDLAKATHLQFNHVGHKVLQLNSPTRFELSGEPVDLRSVFFAWLNKDQPSQEYIAATQKLNNVLSAAGGAGGEVKNLVFAEKLDLITWLERASNESEFIKPLAADKQAADAEVGAEVAAGARDGAPASQVAPIAGRLGRKIDPRLREIYNGERRMGDRNSILHGIKPTDFSHVRKQAALFLKHAKANTARPSDAVPSSSNTNGAMTPNNRARPARRVEPIILLSPSESSLLRMTNIKSFLEDGVYTPPDPTAARPNMLYTTRRLPSIDPQRPLRFALVESAERFKPDDWQRLVAVFTTGQAWQFKQYHWSSPPELFSHALGIYVGWRGEDLMSKPRQQVEEWGRGVMKAQIEKHNPDQPVQARWRDREVVEGIWTAIEESMRAKGFNKDGTLTRR